MPKNEKSGWQMRWRWWQFRSSDRRLDFTAGGWWFLGATLALGIAAIFSGNNIIYLLESLLLSALLFSGVLSELTLRRLSVERLPKQARAGEAGADLVRVANQSWLPLYCVEVGEWGAGETELGFLLYLAPRSQATFVASQTFSRRGEHRWQGLFVATRFPFGFARKLRFFRKEGRRLVWPAWKDVISSEVAGAAQGIREREPADAELEEIPEGEDLSRAHWPSFVRSGKFLRRPLRPTGPAPEVRLVVDATRPDFERKISEASAALRTEGAVLILADGANTRSFFEAGPANDALALLPAGAA